MKASAETIGVQDLKCLHLLLTRSRQGRTWHTGYGSACFITCSTVRITQCTATEALETRYLEIHLMCFLIRTSRYFCLVSIDMTIFIMNIINTTYGLS